MPYFLITEAPDPRGPLFAIWQRDPSGRVGVLRWASRDRRDMQAVSRSLAELDPQDLDPDAQADVIEAGAARQAEGRPLALIELDATERQTIARTIAREIREADERPSLLRTVRTEVCILVGQHLVAMP